MASYCPLSETMSELFLLVFLTLFSGLFPCAEPSTVSDEDEGKRTGPPEMRSPVKLGAMVPCFQCVVVMLDSC